MARYAIGVSSLAQEKSAGSTLVLEGGSLFFLFTNHTPNPNGGVSRRWAGIGRRINRARADFRAEVSIVVIEAPVLQRVAHDALNVEARLAKRHCFLPLVDLQRQRRAPLHHAIRSGVISR